LAPAKRYEVLKAWTMPTTGRKSLRYYVGTTPREVPPEIFVKRLSFPAHRTMSTLLLLADAARETGKSDELAAEAERLIKEKIEKAELLKVLTFLVQGKGKDIEPAVKAFAQAAHQRITEKRERPLGRNWYGAGDQRQPVPLHPSEFLFAALCLGDPA